MARIRQAQTDNHKDFVKWIVETASVPKQERVYRGWKGDQRELNSVKVTASVFDANEDGAGGFSYRIRASFENASIEGGRFPVAAYSDGTLRKYDVDDKVTFSEPDQKREYLEDLMASVVERHGGLKPRMESDALIVPSWFYQHK